MAGKSDIRQIAGARQLVIHEGAGEQLPVLVENDALHQRLPDALRDAAVDLSFDEERIDDGAEVVDADVALDADDAGLRIYLDLADMAAVGIGGDLAV